MLGFCRKCILETLRRLGSTLLIPTRIVVARKLMLTLLFLSALLLLQLCSVSFSPEEEGGSMTQTNVCDNFARNILYFLVFTAGKHHLLPSDNNKKATICFSQLQFQNTGYNTYKNEQLYTGIRY